MASRNSARLSMKYGVTFKDGKTCAICKKKFQLLGRRMKTNCRFCGECVCTSCSKNTRRSKFSANLKRICDACFAKEEQLETAISVFDDDDDDLVIITGEVQHKYHRLGLRYFPREADAEALKIAHISSNGTRVRICFKCKAQDNPSVIFASIRNLNPTLATWTEAYIRSDYLRDLRLEDGQTASIDDVPTLSPSSTRRLDVSLVYGINMPSDAHVRICIGGVRASSKYGQNEGGLRVLETHPCKHKETHTWNQTAKVLFPGHYPFASLALTVELVAKNADVIGSCRVFPSLTQTQDASEHTLLGVGGQSAREKDGYRVCIRTTWEKEPSLSPTNTPPKKSLADELAPAMSLHPVLGGLFAPVKDVPKGLQPEYILYRLENVAHVLPTGVRPTHTLGVLYVTDSRVVHVPYHLTDQQNVSTSVVRRTVNLLSMPMAAIFTIKLQMMRADSKAGLFRFKMRTKTGGKHYFFGYTKPEMASAASPRAARLESIKEMVEAYSPMDDSAPPPNEEWERVKLIRIAKAMHDEITWASHEALFAFRNNAIMADFKAVAFSSFDLSSCLLCAVMTGTSNSSAAVAIPWRCGRTTVSRTLSPKQMAKLLTRQNLIVFGAKSDSPRAEPLAVDKTFPDGPVPKVLVALWTALVSEKGLLQEGIFRIAADKIEAAEVQFSMERDTFLPVEELAKRCPNPFCAASLIKMYYRKLNILDLMDPETLTSMISWEFSEMEASLKGALENDKFVLLKWLLHISAEVIENQDDNRMDENALGVVLVPNLCSNPGWYVEKGVQWFKRALQWHQSAPTETTTAVVVPRSRTLKECVLLRDYRRLGVVDSNRYWMHTPYNLDYSLCDTYPRHLIVPRSFSKQEQLVAAAKCRSRSRLPVLVWIHPTNHAALCRAAQPLSGVSHKNDIEADCQLLHAICKSLSPAQQKQARLKSTKNLNIWDARPRLNADMNAVMGKGFESVTQLAKSGTDASFQFLNIGNIHVMRNSFLELMDVTSFDKYPANFASRVAGSGWLEHVALVLGSSMRIAKALHETGVPALVHCSDGWDRTAQLTATAQLLLDPEYRTIAGFGVLVEKEWCSFGHKMQERCAMRGDDFSKDQSQSSPIFLQWLDVVFQIVNQFPNEFEFESNLLVFLADAVYSENFGNFLCNSEKERLQRAVFRDTISVWDWIWDNRDRFCNSSYEKPSTSGARNVRLLHVESASYAVVLWREFWQRSVTPVGQGRKFAVQLGGVF